MSENPVKDHYENLVELKYQLYNSLFLTLPLDAVEQTGLLLPLLEEASHAGLASGLDPTQILNEFFNAHRPDLDDKKLAEFLFKIIQYVERQVVLIDALEDAAYAEIHRTEESNKLRQLSERVEAEGKTEQLKQILSSFGARVILTAHPTQFYPGSVLAIITDLIDAIKVNDIGLARDLLQQLGNTPFFQKEKPTPLDEAGQLSWYLGNVFYPAIGQILDYFHDYQSYRDADLEQLLSVGFWPGGDRDGNPFVTTTITRQVAERLRARIIECYHREMRELRRRLSFVGVANKVEAIEKKLHKEMTHELESSFSSPNELIEQLNEVQTILKQNYQGLFVDRVISFKRKIAAFGFHFASLDIRQDARMLIQTLEHICDQNKAILPVNFNELEESEQINALLAVPGPITSESLCDPIAIDTLDSLRTMRDIQAANGERACHRYIISNCRGPLDMARLIALFTLSGWPLEELTVDLVPLFETIDDLRSAGSNMETLYKLPAYREHLVKRKDKQTVMLGFSDGTKDGGYLMANWAIYAAKESLTSVSRSNNVEVIFFDGRGGPPARGGGSTYKFYAALGKNIESNQIQLTVQGQTISSYFGTELGATHNLRQLLAAGLENNLYDKPEREFSKQQRALMEELAELGHKKYIAFKNHPLFLPYLEQMSTLNYYGQSNIGSRPAKRGSKKEFRFEDLRAIPFVGAWGQLKQNVPGYFGLGTALKNMEEQGRLDECVDLYKNSGFFRALVGNSMQSMSKANFSLTRYMKEDKVFGEFWQLINIEYELSKEMALKVSGQTVLLEDHPGSRYSIGLRQRVVLPLLIIQQFALMKIKKLNEDSTIENEQIELYENMVVRSLFGNINASRNSA
ncbi:MAG: phosphoenolpyruvate carboxylase [Gammaproteobacteria bacterium]|nr:phosphoenolpyruvate carboxylase [Gammaproteobacteria bacterium]MDD9958608.1 phosphoenolpyruvate carboxylase [Gammaproteobacteria bacterium]